MGRRPRPIPCTATRSPGSAPLLRKEFVCSEAGAEQRAAFYALEYPVIAGYARLRHHVPEYPPSY